MNKLNFGCGKDIKKNWINVDLQKKKGIDYSFNFEEFPYPLKSNHYDYILLDNVLEHLVNLKSVLKELYRISKNNCLIEIKVPYYNCAGAYNDPDHKHYFNKVAILNLLFPEKYYSHSKNELNFELKKLDLIPTKFGKLIPNFIREKVSFIFGEIYSEIKVIIKVKK